MAEVKKDEQSPNEDININSWEEAEAYIQQENPKKKLAIKKIKYAHDRLYQSRNEKQDKLMMFRSFGFYKNRYLDHLNRYPDGHYWNKAFEEFNIFSEDKKVEPEILGFNKPEYYTIFRMFEQCKIPDGFASEYDALSDNCKKVIMDYVYLQINRDYVIEWKDNKEFEIFMNFLISIDKQEIFDNFYTEFELSEDKTKIHKIRSGLCFNVEPHMGFK